MQNPVGLHFSGHACENNPKVVGQHEYYTRTRDTGKYVLVFETEDSAAYFFTES